MNIRSVKLSHRLGKRESEETETKNIVVRESLMIMKALVFKLGGSVILKPEFLEAAKDTDDFVELKYDENGFLRLRIKETDTLN